MKENWTENILILNICVLFYSVLCNRIRHNCCCCFWLIIQIMYIPANRGFSFLKCSGGGTILIMCTQCTPFNTFCEKKQTFILTDCRKYLYISVCIWYEDSFTPIKWWNAHEVTQSSSADVVRVFMSSLRCHTCFIVCVCVCVCVCVLKENAHLCLPFIQRYDRVISDRVNQWEMNINDDSV